LITNQLLFEVFTKQFKLPPAVFSYRNTMS